MADPEQTRIDEIEKELAHYREQWQILREANQPVGDIEDAIARLVAEMSRIVFSIYSVRKGR